MNQTKNVNFSLLCTDLQQKLKNSETNSEGLLTELQEVKASLADQQRQLKASEDKLTIAEDGKTKLVGVNCKATSMYSVTSSMDNHMYFLKLYFDIDRFTWNYIQLYFLSAIYLFFFPTTCHREVQEFLWAFSC